MNAFVLIDCKPVVTDKEAEERVEAERLAAEKQRSDEFFARLLAEAEEIKDR